MKKIIFTICILSGMLICNQTWAQWQSTSGPINAGTIRTIAVDGSFILAGTDHGGVFISPTDNLSWTAVNNGLDPTFSVQTLAVSGSKIFAGTYGNGIFVSSDMGSTWTPVYTGYNGVVYLRIMSIVANPIAGVIYAATLGGGVLVSTDNGVSWMNYYALVMPSVSTLLINDTYIYAGTVGKGIYVSTDMGVSWTAASNGLPVDADITSMVVSGTTIVAGTYNSGIYKSTDNGASWTSANSGVPDTLIHALALTAGTHVFAATDHNGVYMSTDLGSSWAQANLGLTDMSVWSLAVDPNYLYAGTNTNGVWRRPISEVLAVKAIVQMPKAISIYPNPAKDLLTINESSLNGEAVTISLVNVLGSSVKQVQVTGTNPVIDISSLQAGVYYIQALGQQTKWLGKFVKE